MLGDFALSVLVGAALMATVLAFPGSGSTVLVLAACLATGYLAGRLLP